MSRLAAIVLLAAGLGCATAPVRRLGDHLAGDPSWPRGEGHEIAYLGELKVPENLGIERSALSRLWSFFAGEDESPALYRPFAIAIAPDGRIAVADPGRRVVRIYEPSFNRCVTASAGLRYPVAVTFLGGTLLVGDAETARVTAFDGEALPAKLPLKLPQLGRPTGLAVDAARGRLFIVDAAAHCVHVVPLDGGEPTSFGTRGSAPGELNFPTAIAIDRAGRIFITDAMNFRVQIFGADLKLQRIFGELGDSPGRMSKPKGIAVDDAGVVYVVEGFFDVIQAFDEAGELLGVLGGSGSAAGRFWLPAGLAIDASNRLFVADTWNERVQVFALDRRTP